MNKITLLSIAIAGFLAGAGGIWFAGQSRLAAVAAERDAAVAKARSVAASAPAPEAFKALETENQQLKVRLDEMRIQLSAAQTAASAAPVAEVVEGEAAGAAPLDLADLLGSMEWGEVEAPPRRGRKGGAGEGAPGTPGEAGDPAALAERGAWNDPARRAAFENRGTQLREAVQGYLDGEMAKAADRPDVQQRLTQISDYVNDLQQLKEQLRGMEDSPERDALREQLRQTQSAMRDTVHEQQRYLLEEAVAASGVDNPGQARRVANSVRQTMNSPFFRMEPMLSGGRGGGNGRRPGNNTNKTPAP